MRILLHGDDLASSFSGTDRMFECVDHGALNSVSVLASGVAFEQAVREIQKRPALRVALHLNLFERGPLAPESDVHVLLDGNGEFHWGFAALWTRWLRAGAQDRDRLRKAVAAEFAAQLARAKDALGSGWSVEVDGHVHMHMIPFVFDCVMDLAERFNIRYIRLPHERYTRRVAGLTGCATPNFAKVLVLAALSSRRANELQQRGIATCDRFYGLLQTGAMSEPALLGVLDDIAAHPSNGTVEIVLHPAAAADDEAHLWTHNSACRRVYCSPNRVRECEALMAPAVRDRLAELAS